MISIFITLSCNKRAPEKVHDALIIGDPLDCGIENNLMFPLGSNYSPDVYKKSGSSDLRSNLKKTLFFSQNKAVLNDRYATVEYMNENIEDFDIRNILFYDLITGQSYPLHNESLHILSFAIHREFKEPLILYRMVRKDLNMDKKFNSADPVMFYVSNLNGSNLTQVTSENEKFIDYFYYPSTETILIKTIVDSNENLEFEANDETNFLEMKINDPAYGREIFSKSLKDSLRIQIQL